jgi:hypothetical protein
MLLWASVVVFAAVGTLAFAQTVVSGEQRRVQPLYEITIVSTTTKAINYGYLSAPTRIGFQGTPVAPFASGEGTVVPKRGSTLLNLRFKDLPPANRFGSQFLTYVLWAISPDGRAQSLGELMLEGSDKGKLSTSTPLQTFALILTAEPYYAVSQPSEVVVLENVLTRETVGQVREVKVTRELLPRKPYTFSKDAEPLAPVGEPVTSEEHDSLTALYQALNAIQIAHSQNADRYAPEQMSRARLLYNRARGLPLRQSNAIVAMAREAAQIAEDSRAIASKRVTAEEASLNRMATAEMTDAASAKHE